MEDWKRRFAERFATTIITLGSLLLILNIYYMEADYRWMGYISNLPAGLLGLWVCGRYPHKKKFVAPRPSSEAN